MGSEQSSPQAEAAAPRRRPRFFYVGASAALIVFVVWGFHHFYLGGKAYPGRELSPPIKTLVILHGSAMAAWMLLMLGQPALIAAGNRRLHMKIGVAGAVLAGLIVILGLKLGIESTRHAPPDAKIWGCTAKQFMAVPIFSILIFGGLVAAGIANRKKPEIHRAMMLLATLAALAAAVSRIDAISNLYMGTILDRLFGPFLGTLVIAFILLGVKSFLSRSVNRYYAFGCAGLTAASLLIMLIARTGAWESFASMLVG